MAVRLGNKPVIGNVWFNEDYFPKMLEGEGLLVEDLEDLNLVDMLVFWGGEDVHPRYYGERSRYAYVTDAAERDKFESFLFREAVSRDIPIVGICRGAQLCCVLSGGKLWQDVKHHNADHLIRMQDGEIVMATSTHHQMMRPGKGVETIAISDKILSPAKYNEHGAELNSLPEPEICFSSVTNALMIQGHPEYPHASDGFRQLTYKLINKYFGAIK